jgi:uncharacterized membrane protein
MMETIRLAMEWAAFALDALAVAVIVSGALIATVHAALTRAAHPGQPRVVSRDKQRMVNGLLWGLDLLVAADVIRTVVLEATLYNVATLGLVVLIRVVLTWSLVIEVEERWPWQPRRTAGTAGTDTAP